MTNTHPIHSSHSRRKGIMKKGSPKRLIQATGKQLKKENVGRGLINEIYLGRWSNGRILVFSSEKPYPLLRRIKKNGDVVNEAGVVIMESTHKTLLDQDEITVDRTQWIVSSVEEQHDDYYNLTRYTMYVY